MDLKGTQGNWRKVKVSAGKGTRAKSVFTHVLCVHALSSHSSKWPGREAPLGFAFSSFQPSKNCTLLNGSIYTMWTISWSRDCTFNFTRWTLWLLTNASSLVHVVGEKVALGILLTKTLTLFRTFYEFKRWPDEICRVYVNCTWPIISGIIKADWMTSINFFILSIFTIFVTITNPWFPNTLSSTFVARKFRFIDTWTCRAIFGLLQSVVVVTWFRI